VRSLKQKQWKDARAHFSQAMHGPVNDLTGTLLSAWSAFGANDAKGAVDAIDKLSGPEWYGIFKDMHAGLMFDQLRQDQTIGLSYSEGNGRRTAGLVRRRAVQGPPLRQGDVAHLLPRHLDPQADDDLPGLTVQEIAEEADASILLQLDESDRDALPQTTQLDPARESLQLSHFATAGDLTRAFETIAWDSDELARQVSWTAPRDAGLVRFWLVLRDFRGGGAFVERAVCVE